MAECGKDVKKFLDGLFQIFTFSLLKGNPCPIKSSFGDGFQLQFPTQSHACQSLRLELHMERRVGSINRFRTGLEGMKARDIEKKYQPEKAKRFLDLLRSKGLFYWDEDFPKDEEDMG